MAEPNPYYAIQPAFTGGEISEDIASRVDLDKYQLALLQAENAVVRPYGPVRKRSGFIYCGQTKYSDKKCMLFRFEFSVDLNYMLEIGDKYIRIWRDGRYLGVEIATPYSESEIPLLRFVQSVDVVYICSGKYPVKKLARYSETDWRLNDVNWSRMPFGDINPNEDIKITPNGTTGNITLSATGDIFNSDRIGDKLKIDQYINGETVSLQATAKASYTTPQFTMNDIHLFKLKKTGSGSADVSIKYVTDRGTVNDIYLKGSGETEWEAGPVRPVTSLAAQLHPLSGYIYTGNAYIYASNISGYLTLTLTNESEKTARTYEIWPTYTYSGTVRCGKTWKVITHGTWTGAIVVQQSKDNGETWLDLRTYTSKDDYNPTESGDVDEYSILRVRAEITSGTCNIDLSSYPYTHTGYVTITSVTSSREAAATTDVFLGSAAASSEWYWCAWSKTNGYPHCAAFFQDRLVFGANDKYPQRVWMSRSGDYENFEIEKEAGSVTDDSAVTADLLSLRAYTISHMDVGNDLVIFTEGNVWTISGGETVTPSNITPRNQENYGTNNVGPIRVGSRCIYIQRRGSIVRDIGYSYDSDSYTGLDLTLLAKHLIRNHTILDGTYAQEPDSTLYFVREDGVLICLTYLVEQKVYGWSHYVTDGEFEQIQAIASGNNDILYAVIKRNINGQAVRYIEKMDIDRSGSNSQKDYCLLDSAIVINGHSGNTLTGLTHLEGKKIYILADGYLYDKIMVKNGSVTLPQSFNRAMAGLPYTMILEQPNWDAGGTDSGTVQGRKKHVSEVILRLTSSFGGWVGPDAGHLNEIIYDSERLERGEDVLYSGDKKVTMAMGGFNTQGRSYIKHDTPYPFILSAIIREVSFGG